MRKNIFLLIFILLLAVFNGVAQQEVRSFIRAFYEEQAKVHYINQTALSPDAKFIAWCADDKNGSQTIYKAPLSQPEKTTRITAGSDSKFYNELDPQWSPDGGRIAFLSNAKTKGQLQLFVANASGAGAKQLSKFDGYVSHVKWSPDGKFISVLYVEKASRTPSPMAAVNRFTGIIDSFVNSDIQRIAVVNTATGETKPVTPAGLYVFEYDWCLDSKQFAYTAALPPGDDNWYIAKLYKQTLFAEDTVMVYKPLLQIAVPRWSPDGKQIAFIEGLMSDQGGTGGEIFSVSSSGNSKPENLTPKRKSSPSWLAWKTDNTILFSEFVGGSIAISTLNTQTKESNTLWKADAKIRAGNEETSLSVADNTFAFSSAAWDALPEVWAGDINNIKQFTHLNSHINLNMPRWKNVSWVNDNQNVQGWVLYPANYDSTKQYPLLTCVHGGPAWVTTSNWTAPDFNATVYTQLGYFLFLPNPRGSHGQGEAFTLANRRNWGFGDLSDITTGVDFVASQFPIDKKRIGILGWSYGGSMSMIAGTQTKIFSAAVAGAGAGDWLSYYGQNSIDKWMWGYFGVSPYDEPAAYSKVSAMTYIKNTKTPTLLVVGERDGEAPPPQSFQYWHALKELHVPTQLIVYADEGHSFEKFENMIDVTTRTVEWFNKYMPADK